MMKQQQQVGGGWATLTGKYNAGVSLNLPHPGIEQTDAIKETVGTISTLEE
jgi:hypothetical protein